MASATTVVETCSWSARFGHEDRDDAAAERAQEAAEVEPRAADRVASHPRILAKSSENAGS